jgi:VCBS repeat-containing protein
LAFTYNDDGTAMHVDQISVDPETAPPTESTAGSIAFADVQAGKTHTAGFVPLEAGDVGTFSLDPINDGGGSGSVAWHFTVNNADIAFLAPGQTLTQDCAVTVADNFGGTAVQDVAVVIHGTSPQNLTVNPGATLDIGSAFGGSVTFASSTGTLQLDTSTAFTGQVSGLSGLDTLDLRDITAGASAAVNFSGTASGGTLTVSDGTHIANINLLGDYTSSTFVASDGGHGGTSVVDPPAAGNPSIPNVGLLANHMASAFATGSASGVITVTQATIPADAIVVTLPQHACMMSGP